MVGSGGPAVRGITDRNHQPWPGKTVASHVNDLTTGGPCKERGANELPPTGRIWERSRGERRRQSTRPANLPESSSLPPSWLSDACTTRKDPESERLARDRPQTHPFTTNPETVNCGSRPPGPPPSCSLPQRPFPIKSPALSARVSPQTIRLPVLDRRPPVPPAPLRPGRRSLSPQGGRQGPLTVPQSHAERQRPRAGGPWRPGRLRAAGSAGGNGPSPAR